MPHKILATCLAALLLLHPSLASASMTSSSYIIQNDTTGCGGGKSTSTNFILFDTLCDTAADQSSSSSYVVQSGFQASQDIPFITVTISASSVAFGTLTTESVATGTVTVTVSTNALSGYASTIITDGNFRTSGGDAMTNASASDTISAASGKYGIATSGADGQYNATDTGISTTAKVFAQNSAPADSIATVVTFKAAQATTTPSGSYSQTVTIITTGTF